MLHEEFGQVPIQINPDLKLCEEGINSIRSSKVAIIDLASLSRNSRLFIRQIHELCPNTSIVALHIYNETEFIKPLIDAGASTYMQVNADSTEMVTSLRKLLHPF
ncbi:MAG: response regulator transcription factor [Desulfobacterales bacterium]|nr:response regulator transcription factor [Desulfobacterales bacterium]